MLKRTLYLENPVHLGIRNQQLTAVRKDTGEMLSLPVEDLGFVVLAHREITFTLHVMEHLAENNTAVIFCNQAHHPSSMLLPLDGHTIQTERFRTQIEASEPLKKQLWQQTIKAKIRNQAQLFVLEGQNEAPLLRHATQVKSGDPSNEEAQASKYYWSHLFDEFDLHFRRERNGFAPNNLLNYGYAILRAATARALTGSGLLPTFGIHHRNKYNAFCLADDLMEPYRPLVDQEVLAIMRTEEIWEELTKNVKSRLLRVLDKDVRIDGKKSPLMIALTKTSASLVRCFEGEQKQVLLPEFYES